MKNPISAPDSHVVRACLQERVERDEMIQAVLDLLLFLFLVAGLAVAYGLLCSPARADVRSPGPTESSLAGLLISLVPIAIAAVLVFAVLRRAPLQPSEDEIYGDTTRYGEAGGER